MGQERQGMRMFTLLKHGHVFAPQDLGTTDVLLVGRNIAYIADEIGALPFAETEVYDVAGCFVVPGFIDQHVHLIGGGGKEDSPPGHQK
jgi:beta-aspartyl-dipeptidase (metallo-type)